MSNGRQLFVVGTILAVFGLLVIAGGPALTPGDGPGQSVDADGPDDGPGESDGEPTDDTGEEPTGEADDGQTDGTGEEQFTVPEVVEECAAVPPEDFADPEGGNAVVGWVDGYWYDEPLDIDVEDGITEAQLENLSARTAARFEAMRCITADEGVPPVEILTREEFQEEQSELFADVSGQERLFDNAKLAAMLLVDTETNSIGEREANRGASVGGTYNFRDNEITIVSDDPENLLIDEEILAHELGHAIQDQQFNLSRYERPTVDVDKGTLGLIEGDVHLVEQEYLDACLAGEWNEECLTETTGTEQSDVELANWGLYFKNFQPYSDGPTFVQHVHESGGWDAVDELYENPPTSVLQIVNPEQFPELQPVEVEVADESSDEWERLRQANGPNSDTIGIAGISAMFMAPAVETQGAVTIYDPQQFINPEGSLSPFDYLHPETEGWRGDSLYAYRGADNQTGTVWELQWDEPADWEPFVDSYERLIEYRGGEPVTEDGRTYEFSENSSYELAVTIDTDGNRVTIVTAPTVDELSEIHDVEPATGG